MDHETPPDGAPALCVETAEFLVDCGESPREAFYADCESDLSFAADCHADCDVQVSGCYGGGAECRTLADIEDCVSSAINFEACLCD